MKSNSVDWYISQFPESQFLVSQENKFSHDGRVIQGHGIAQQSTVLICGIMRNVAKILPYTTARIEALGKLFKRYDVFIYENDSTDTTKDDLDAWAIENPLVQYKSEDVGAPHFNDLRGLPRKTWMAYARNQYLNYASKFTEDRRIDYIIVVDTDLEGGWSYHGVLNSLAHQNWDVVGSNSLYYHEQDGVRARLYYDSWAFRPLGHPEALPDTEANLFQFHRGEPMIQVNSCFGGLGIYKSIFLNEGLVYNESDCDHPSLHNQLCERGYRIFMNPSQITLYNRTGFML